MRPALAIFARAPDAGRAKTRLASVLGPWGAALAYADLLRTALRVADGLQGRWRAMVYAAGREDLAWFRRNWAHGEVCLQREGRLGERLQAAFDDLFQQGHERVVVVASDVPDLVARIVRQAGALLERNPAVLGPCEDGGYYLIGQRRPGWDLFSDITWSTELVYGQTLARARDQGLSVGTLPRLYDVDDMQAYRRYVADVSYIHQDAGASSGFQPCVPTRGTKATGAMRSTS